MALSQKLLVATGIITSLSIIFTWMFATFKFLRRWDKWVEKKDAHDRENYLSILQLKIMSPTMPISERVKAGDIYIKLGGNGEVKQKYYELLTILPTFEEIHRKHKNESTEYNATGRD